MSSLISEWSEDEYDDDHSYYGRNNQSSFESIELVVRKIFGSCSANLHHFFVSPTKEHLKPIRHRGSRQSNINNNITSIHSHGTATTDTSSTNSNPKQSYKTTKSKTKQSCKKKRSRSLDCRRKEGNDSQIRRHRSLSKSCQVNRTSIVPQREYTEIADSRRKEGNDYQIRRHRSLSKSCQVNRTSIVPQREYTEIAVVQHQDDDVSAISAYTLDEMHYEEMQQLAMLRQHNVLSRDDAASHISQKSSGTTEFESIWRTKSRGSPNHNTDDKRHLSKGAIYRDSCVSRRKGLKKSSITTIDEDNSLYVDEQEI